MKNVRMTIWMVVTVLVMAAGNIFGAMEFKDGGTHNIDYAFHISDIYVDYLTPGMQTTINLLSGGDVQGFNAYEDSRINIIDGYVGNLDARDRSQVTMSGGTAGCLDARDSSQVTMSGGLVRDNLRSWGNSQVTISGGSVGIWLITLGNSQVTMSGGTNACSLNTYDSSRFNWSGGTMEGELMLGMEDGSTAIVTIYGYNFAIDGTPFGFGEITSILGGDWGDEPFRHLSGTLLSGDLLNNDFRIGYNAKIILVPEPNTLPIADADGPYTIYVGDTLTLDASGSTDEHNNIVSYIWDLDDNNSFETDAGDQPVFDVNFAYLQSIGLLVGNTYNIHLKVTDSAGQSDVNGTTLTIIPQPSLQVIVDIKPGSCPNPLNVKSSGVLPVAILGTGDYDITTIDATSIRLAGVEPLRSSFEDVAGPAADSNDCNCTEDGPDGLLDLTLKFKTQKIVEVIGDVNEGDILTLELTGVLIGERPIEGADCIFIRGKHKPFNKADLNEDGVVNSQDFAILADNWLQSSIAED
ncbi:MAG: PKD domain-containing protein [Sedimentisphaerales bacterium]|nr:PKD domain-containing protein [Sedimentisphaerales bacterium]